MMDFSDALRYLDDHAGYDVTGRIESPSLDRIERLMDVSGRPQHAYPVIHITGTNGKGSTTQMITRLLMAHGLKVGTYTSPHLERVNERLAIDAQPIGDDDFAAQIAGVADLELIAGVRPSYFEALTAAAFRWFAEEAVDVAVVEVGLLGRWDATNVCDAQVAVITNIGLDHTEFAGPTTSHIATEKSGIIKSSSVAVVGETDPDMVAIFRRAGGRLQVVRGEDFDVVENQLALGGRLVDLRTATSFYSEVFIPLHGAHQADNAVVALAAVEAFFGRPLDDGVVREAFAEVRMPGRFEVIGHQPLVIVDGAHNAPGADIAAQVFFDDFIPAGRRILVVGCLANRDPEQMLAALRADEFDRVIVCTAPSPRGRPARDLGAAAERLGCDDVLVVDDVAAACAAAVRGADADDAVLVTGSLYVVGAARPAFAAILP